MIVVEGLSAGYGEQVVLRDVSLSVGQGSVTALLGRNGAGKSTLVYAIMGMVDRFGGHVAIDGKGTERLSTTEIARLGVGLVPQGRRVFPQLTVAENLQVVQRSREPQSFSVSRILDLFPPLGPRLKLKAAHLSGGEQQMLAVARALMTNPSVLLLDEPTEGLAPQYVEVLIQSVGALSGEGMSVLLVEQAVSLALVHSDHLYVLEKGEIVQSGGTSTFRERPQLLARHLGV